MERAKALRRQGEQPAPTPEASPGVVPQPTSGKRGLGYAPQFAPICQEVSQSLPVDFRVLTRNHIVVGDSYPIVAEEYKILRTHLLHKTKKEGLNTLMFTSPRPGGGKSLTAINIAISLAQEVEHTVLLVDTDLREPSLHRALGLSVPKGLVDFLRDGVPIHELLVQPEGLDKVILLPGGRPTTEAAELIRSPQMVNLVQELKHCYPERYVLFDLPPLLLFADALAFAPLIDGVVLVLEANQTTREDLQECLELLKEFNILGLVINKVKKPKVKEYYNYYYQKRKAPSFWQRVFG